MPDRPSRKHLADSPKALTAGSLAGQPSLPGLGAEEFPETARERDESYHNELAVGAFRSAPPQRRVFHARLRMRRAHVLHHLSGYRYPGTSRRFGAGIAHQPRVALGTIGINVTGSFVIGFFGTLTLAQGRYPVSENIRSLSWSACVAATPFSPRSALDAQPDTQRCDRARGNQHHRFSGIVRWRRYSGPSHCRALQWWCRSDRADTNRGGRVSAWVTCERRGAGHVRPRWRSR